ncbi:hypothetical protein CRUP_006852, partial [Coryphaenoides rupestris]
MCSVSSVVEAEVKPFSSSCWSPRKPLHRSWPCSFSSFSRRSGLSRHACASSLPSSRRDIWYSNSKSDSMSDTATQKTNGSAWRLSAPVEEEEDSGGGLPWAGLKQACRRSMVALRGGSAHDERSASPNFLGTEELRWCRLRSERRRFSWPVLFRSDIERTPPPTPPPATPPPPPPPRKSREEALEGNNDGIYEDPLRVALGDRNGVLYKMRFERKTGVYL